MSATRFLAIKLCCKFNMHKKLLFCILLFIVFLTNFLQAQSTKSEYLVRSTVGVSGASESITVRSKSYFVQQSIGQASAIGTFHNYGYTLRQGFIQSNVLAKIIDTNMSLDLEATFYPNPFIEGVTLAFTEKIEGNIEVAVFDLLGRLVFSKNYTATQNLKMQFKNLSIAGHILKVTANNKQFIKNIIKK